MHTLTSGPLNCCYFCLSQFALVHLLDISLRHSSLCSNDIQSEIHSVSPLKQCRLAQLCLTLWDPIDCSLPGSSVHAILQARIKEWVAIPFSRGSSQARDQCQSLASPVLSDGFFTTELPGKTSKILLHPYFFALFFFVLRLSATMLYIYVCIFSFLTTVETA